MGITAMKSLFIGIVLLSGAFQIPRPAFSSNLEERTDKLSNLTPDEVLDKIVEIGQKWPKLDALSQTDVMLRDDARQLTIQVLEALKFEANSIVVDASKNSITERIQRAMRISKAAKRAGGYLNDLISVSGENVAITGAWMALDQWPESATTIKNAVYRDSKKDPLWARKWFAGRIELDSWLSQRKERLAKVKDNTPGFQAGNYLGYERLYPNNEKPTVFDLIDTPDLNVLWWKVFYNDFNLASTIPAACDYLNKGGVLTPAPKHKPNAVAAVFGEEGVPYVHQLREDSFRSSDIWVSRDSILEKMSRDINFRNWFGE